MAHVLYRLGRWSVDKRRLVLAFWIGLLVLGGIGAATLSGDTSDSFELPGTESQAALDQLAERMPGAGGATARVVFQSPDGTGLSTTAHVEAIEATVASLRDAPQVVNVVDPFESSSVSPDGTIGYATVSYAVPAAELTGEAKDALRSAAALAADAGLGVDLGGDALTETPHSSSAEAIGLAVAIVVLLFTFGSLIAAGLPILTALIGVGLGMAGITIATGFLEMSSTAPTLAVMLGLAVGIDYALFIVTRHRQLMATGLDVTESAARAVGTAGSAVVFAGATVVIALLGLVVVGIPFLTVMGAAAAATVAVSVIIAVTLLPALLGFSGTTIDRFRVPGVRMRSGLGEGRDPLGMRWASFVVRRAKPVLVVALAAIAVFAVPASSIEMGLPDDGTKPASSSERRAFDLLAEGFGPGFNGPLIVTADLTDVADRDGALRQLHEALEPLDNVVAVAPPTMSPDGTLAIVSVIPGTAPSATGTADLVDAIRTTRGPIEDATGMQAKVTGSAAINIDITTKLGEALPIYALVVVGLALVLLTMVFRSVLVPLKAALGFLLSVLVSFGATVAVFQWGWLAGAIGIDEPGPIISILPILLLGILFGLAMDYEVFLVSRIREDFVHTGDARGSIIDGVRHSARVIVAAGLIMIAVFSAFVLSSDANVKMIGFALAAGVLADAFVVRMTIVPAVLAILGERAWRIPRWLDRIIPNVDIEGESLAAKLAPAPAADAPTADAPVAEAAAEPVAQP